MEEPSQKKHCTRSQTALSLRVNALESVVFHPCECLEDYRKPPVTFSPTFAHHFFGLDQVIVGFEQVAVRIYFIPDTLDMFVKIDGDSPSIHASCERVMACLTNDKTKVAFPGGFCPSEHDFLAKLECRATRGQKFQPPGKPVGVLRHTAGAGDEQIEIEVRRCTFADSEFKSLHRRMEWFFHWFIDGASKIDHDGRWHVYVAYKRPPGGVDYPSHSRKPKPGASSGRPACLSLCGLATAYTFPSLSSSRRRLSQFLIFPHYQRKGVGLDLLQLIYQQTLDDPHVCEMDVEDPAPAFVQLRDVVTVKLAIDNNLVSPLALWPPPPEAEVPSSASAAFPASSGLGLTNGHFQPEVPLYKTRNRTRALHKALTDTGASSGSSAACGDMSRRGQKRKRRLSAGDEIDIDSGVPAVAARDVAMCTRSRTRGMDGGRASSSSAAAAAGGGGGGGGSHHGTGRSGMTLRGGRGKRSVGKSEGRKMEKVNHATSSIPTIDSLALDLKETKQQATRSGEEVLQFARLLQHPLPAEIPPSYLDPGTSKNGHTKRYHNGHRSDTMELEALPSSSSASNGLGLGLGGAGGGSGGEEGDWEIYRLGVMHRLRKDVKDSLTAKVSLTPKVSKEEGDLDFFGQCDKRTTGDRTFTRNGGVEKAVQDEFKELVQSYISMSIKKVRRLFPAPPHIKNEGDGEAPNQPRPPAGKKVRKGTKATKGTKAKGKAKPKSKAKARG
ncbi:unnamed protein product [Vitrella brassicaformis CCMP3155]|uniref:histone acetyltransferase n=1 Tax=Vitrella brassicaformis (strain CCMP3155) TaxID=1169540 RepID=A0A0G4FDP4_VITBC|nr:unnamed protein product [Vitrella brassicaformis CCMP3155]|eukprot:CEM11299.1 unnamed protein product [Vitrella brassicaformis CCMP3155]